MKLTHPETSRPADADARRALAPVVCYPVSGLPVPDMARYRAARATLTPTGEVLVQPREARTFHVPAGHFFRTSDLGELDAGELLDVAPLEKKLQVEWEALQRQFDPLDFALA